MSQMTSSARVGARALNRPTTQTVRLRVVSGAPLRQGNAVFGVLCASLLAIGLIGLLLLNTNLAQGSFTLHDLRTTSDALTDTQGALSESVDASSAAANLAKAATSMGMVPSQTAAFLRLSDDTVIGVAQPASRTPGFTVVGTPGPVAVAPKPVKTGPAPATAANKAPAQAATKPITKAPVSSATGPVKSSLVTTNSVKPAKR
jgi:hypothetical protein